MPDDVLFLNAVRKEDFLSITFELRNLQPQGAPARLMRINPDLPAFVIVHFPPQHVQEQAFWQDTTRPPFGPVPVQSLLSGPSRLAFQLPPALDGLDFTLQALLDWTSLQPSLPANALPADINSEADLPYLPGLAEPAATQTAIEFPSALILSPDASAGWAHAVQPVTHGGRTELWHTRLGSYLPLPDERRLFFEPGRLADKLGLHPHVRAVWYRDANPADLVNWRTSLTAKDRWGIANLSGNFQIRARIPLWVLAGAGGGLEGAARAKQWLAENHIPASYVPKAIPTRRLMLTSAGAWASLEGSWDFPVITNPDLIDEDIYPSIDLQQWQQIAAGGRDNYVRVVTRGYMCPLGNRAVVLHITERVFEPQQVRVEQGPDGAFSVFGAVAYLRQYEVLVIQEPLRIFSNFENAFKSGRREMPFRKMTILTRITPLLDPHPDDASFFPKVGTSEYKFKISAEDNDGQISGFEIPLMFVPANGHALETAAGIYNSADVWLRTAQTHNQPVAFAVSSPDKPGDGVLKLQSLTFQAQTVDSAHGMWLPSPVDPYFLPEIGSAQAGIPAVERLLGKSTPVTIAYHKAYLDNGFDPQANKGEVFAALPNPLPLPFSAEKGGGVAKPQADINGLSRALGPVSNPDAALAGQVDTSAFNNASARLLGSIPLVDLLLPNSTFEKAELDITHLPEDQLAAWLDDTNHLLKLPVLVSHQVQDPAAIETTYLWKPAIQPVTIDILTLQTSGVFPDANADLLLRARLLTLLDGGKSVMTIFGRLRNFALDFADILSLNVRSLSFSAEQGKKVDLSAEGVDLIFRGPLEFVNTLKDILPANGFSDPPFLNVDTSGITAGYSLGVPSVGVGIFSIQNIALAATLSLPLIDRPAGVRFAISERHKPFLVTVTLFGGGGFFALALNASGLEQVEAAIEFGGNISINLGVASGGVYVMAGIYFSLTPKEVKLTGYLRVGGSLEVLGLICISIEFYLGFTYRSKDGGGGEVWGQATVTVEVEVLCFSKSVSMTVEKRFAGAAGDPTFEQVVAPADWEEYVLAFA
jgi:hypothetical protein